MEQLNYNLLSGWFVGLEIDDGVWDHAVFSKNRDRRLNQDLAQKFFAHVKHQMRCGPQKPRDACVASLSRPSAEREPQWLGRFNQDHPNLRFGGPGLQSQSPPESEFFGNFPV